MLVGFILNLVFNLVLRYIYARENKKRDRALEGKSEEELEALREQSRAQGFENITDKENVSPFFLTYSIRLNVADLDKQRTNNLTSRLCSGMFCKVAELHCLYHS